MANHPKYAGNPTIRISDDVKLGEGVKRIRQTIGEHLCDFKMCLNNG